MNDQRRAPLWEALLEYREKQTARFHVPGHKGRAGLDPEATRLLAGVYSVDLTEITGMDDLHQPEGVIAEAEQLAAECYGADRTFFLVGGSTAGNLALILSTCKPGDLLLVQRNAHKSIINGLMLAGARAAFLSPPIDPQTGLPGGLRQADVELALDKYPQAVGLLLTDPNYYGIGADLRPIVEAAHRRDVPVLVDAAHGAHFGFHPKLPSSALAAGADGVVHSTHKMLTAMTMGAMLHVQGSRLDQAAVARALTTLQSSSPSYPIMSSLDLARRQLATSGASALGQAIQVADRLRDKLAALPWLRLVRPVPAEPGSGSAVQDPLKLAFSDRTATLTGFELAANLERHGCFAEMADPAYVTLTIGLSTSDCEADRLIEALLSISAEYALVKKELQAPTKNIDNVYQSNLSQPISFSYHAKISEHSLHQVKLDEAVHHTAHHQIVPYPPGVPLLYPGETITPETVGKLKEWLAAGSRIHGLRLDGTLTIRKNGDAS